MFGRAIPFTWHNLLSWGCNFGDNLFSWFALLRDHVYVDLRGPVRECRSMTVNLTFGKNLIHVLLLDKMSRTYIPAFNSLI